jgi:NAD(P)-dependent dehydrogenase (short-subunit alcohol dehydrogenase family)
MYDMTGQVALVTGAAQGIGLGIAMELARVGIRVAIGDRDLQKAQEAIRHSEVLAGKAIACFLDVTDEKSIADAVRTVINQFSRIDILVNNAGIHCEKIGQASTIEQFNRCWDVNLLGVWRVTLALVPHFRSSGGGRIVNIASINGRKPMRGAPGYSASKAAVINVTQSLAAELGPNNINVNAVCPGGVITAMAEQFRSDIPDIEDFIMRPRALKRELLPEDIGRAVVFFASDNARCITGQALNVDCGFVMS